jgi:hypothetical protein
MRRNGEDNPQAKRVSVRCGGAGHAYSDIVRSEIVSAKIRRPILQKPSKGGTQALYADSGR